MSMVNVCWGLVVILILKVALFCKNTFQNSNNWAIQNSKNLWSLRKQYSQGGGTRCVWRSPLTQIILRFRECHRNQNSATSWRSSEPQETHTSKPQNHPLCDILRAELSLTLSVLFLAVSCCSSWEIWLLEFSLSLVRLPWSLWTSSTSWAISRSFAASSTSKLERVSTSMACSWREKRIRPKNEEKATNLNSGQLGKEQTRRWEAQETDTS